MKIRLRSIAMMLLTALRAMDRLGGKHAGSVYGKQYVIVDRPKPHQNLPPLQLGKDHPTQIKRTHFIKTLAHPRITGHTVHPKETLAIGQDRRGAFRIF